ncbi:MAG: hypothetical protein IJX01_01020 [Oscillospiraceae bacterium]|nr:hypothetical protein [Oscillospiraceae bacterium]
MKFKEITIQGTPYERGLSHGQQCREEIGVSIQVYGTLFEELKGLSWEDARKISEFYLSKTRDFAPDYVEEMRGIAEGANVDLLDIAALNARTEIMFAQLDAQECTTLSLLPPATEGGRVIAAQNWDFYRQLRDSIVILHVRQENKPNFVMVSEAGMIGGIGMNDRGIGVLLNALTADTTCQGIPLRTRMRAMLDSDTLAEAYAKGSHKPTSVGHLVATHKDGVAVAFEMDSKGIETIIPEDGVWVHTNHYLGPKMYQAHDAVPRASTYIRLQRIQALVKEAHGKITKETVMHMLRDHAGYPYSLCTHQNPKDPVTTQYVTNFAIIMDLTEGCFYLAPGNPCESEFKKHDI